jgi:hypothetical protein
MNEQEYKKQMHCPIDGVRHLIVSQWLIPIDSIDFFIPLLLLCCAWFGTSNIFARYHIYSVRHMLSLAETGNLHHEYVNMSCMSHQQNLSIKLNESKYFLSTILLYSICLRLFFIHFRYAFFLLNVLASRAYFTR